MKDQWWLDRATNLQAAADRNDVKAFYDSPNAVYDPTSKGSTPVYSSGGQTLIRDQDRILTRWVEHFKGVLNRESAISAETSD